MGAFFAMMNRMKYIRRWGLMRNSQPEDIQQHSAQCAMFAHALAVLGNTRLGKQYDPAAVALRALYHEAAEVLTGDLATPIKYFNPEIRAAYRQIEDQASQKLLHSLPADFQPDYAPLLQQPQDDIARLVKAADKLCALVKCLEEAAGGNPEFDRAAQSTRDSLQQMQCPEAELFMQLFVPAFSLPVDDLTV